MCQFPFKLTGQGGQGSELFFRIRGLISRPPNGKYTPQETPMINVIQSERVCFSFWGCTPFGACCGPCEGKLWGRRLAVERLEGWGSGLET